MQIRFTNSPQETAQMCTTLLRTNFLVDNLFAGDQVNLVYSHYDRMIIGGARPAGKSVPLPNPSALRAHYFLERRECGIINVGADGTVLADGKEYYLRKLDCLYLARGTQHIQFKSVKKNDPALFYFLSSPAHHRYTNKLLTKEKATPVELGAAETANKRTVYKYIYAGGIKSCQLVMGLTVLAPASVWNSIPPHTHTRRMEVYFYFDLPEDQRVFHFMGETDQTKHLLVANHEAVISPPWSTHFGCGTSSYGFIWGMAGENQDYTNMDQAPVAILK